MPRQLTAKQALFAELVASGAKGVDAYLEAYDAEGMSRASARAEASKLANNIRVSRMIERLTQGKKEEEQEISKASSQWVRSQLQAEALSEENPPASRIRALELLGKAQGMFTDKVVVETDGRTVGDIEREIAERLSAMFKGADGQAN